MPSRVADLPIPRAKARSAGAPAERPLPGWIVAACLGLIACALAVRILFFVDREVGADEMTFALVGQAVLSGHLPYSLAFDNKPAGLYYVFSASELLFGQGYFAVQVVSIIAALTTAAVIARTARVLSATPGFMVAAVAIYLGLSLTNGGTLSTSEIVASPAVALGLLLAVRRATNAISSPRFWLLSGVVLGLGSQLSYLVAPIGGLIGLVCLGIEIRDRVGVPALLKYVGFAAIGFGLSFGAVLLPQIITGDVTDYFRMQFRYHESYAATTTWIGLVSGFSKLRMIVLPLLAAGALRFVALARSKSTQNSLRVEAVLAAGLVGALIAVWVSHRFYEHYFILVVPTLVGLTLALTATLPRRSEVLAIAVALAVGFALSARDGHLALAWYIPQNLDARVADYIRANTTPDQRIFVFDESPSLYYLSRREPASRFVFPTHYLERAEANSLGIDVPSLVGATLRSRPALVAVGTLWPDATGFDIRGLLQSMGYKRSAEFAQRQPEFSNRNRSIEIYRLQPGSAGAGRT